MVFKNSMNKKITLICVLLGATQPFNAFAMDPSSEEVKQELTEDEINALNEQPSISDELLQLVDIQAAGVIQAAVVPPSTIAMTHIANAARAQAVMQIASNIQATLHQLRERYARNQAINNLIEATQAQFNGEYTTIQQALNTVLRQRATQRNLHEITLINNPIRKFTAQTNLLLGNLLGALNGLLIPGAFQIVETAFTEAIDQPMERIKERFDLTSAINIPNDLILPNVEVVAEPNELDDWVVLDNTIENTPETDYWERLQQYTLGIFNYIFNANHHLQGLNELPNNGVNENAQAIVINAVQLDPVDQLMQQTLEAYNQPPTSLLSSVIGWFSRS
jgi:hypothetical protein